MSVVHEDEVEAVVTDRGKAHYRRRQLGKAAGGSALGCSLIELPPSKSSWPFHWHAANEEAIYVLEGSGTLRLGEERLDVKAGSYAALRVGPEHAHQMINTGEVTLCYLVFSTMEPVEVAGYPDSGKVGVLAGAAPGGGERYLSAFFSKGANVDYWDDET
ncbi:MAG: cupin domain-containing protein [Myxococcota bacterium]